MAADLNGNVLSYVEKGASSIYKDVHAKENVRSAIEEALRLAGSEVSDVFALVAGIAGYDSEADKEWVLPLTEVEGLDCPKRHVNDAVVAHAGALLTEPGIVVIAGTGSIIYAVNEDGRAIRNYDLHHYAATAARTIAYETVYEILAGNIESQDQALVRETLQFWGAASIRELSALALQGFVPDERERNRRFAQLAPIITRAAMQHSPLAQKVCDRAIHQIEVGVELLGAYFNASEVSVAFIGSVVDSRYYRQQLRRGRQKAGNNKAYWYIEPALSPVAGAVLLAWKALKLPIASDMLVQLSRHP